MSSLLVRCLCEEVFKWRCFEYPEFATFCGCHDYDDRLNNHSVSAFEKRKTSTDEFLKQVGALEGSKNVSESDQLNLLLLKEELLSFQRGSHCKGYVFPLSSIDGIHLDFGRLLNYMPFKTEPHFLNYLERLKALPYRILSDIELMRHGISIGLTHYKGSMVDVPGQIGAVLDADPKETNLYKPLVDFPDGIASSALERFRETGRRILVDEVWPAFVQLKEFLVKVYLPSCRLVEGISNIPDGLRFYEESLRYHTSLEMSPADVHDIGLREMESVRAKMEQVLCKVGYKGTITEFVEYLRKEPRFYFSDKDACLQGFREVCFQKIRPRLKKVFFEMPSTELCIEEEKGPSSSFAYYRAGSPDGSRPGMYMISMPDLKMCPKYNMISLSLHEAEPGHHFQGMRSVMSEDLPSFRRFLEDMYYSHAPSKFPIYTSYMEGWALYSEFLGYELGLYDSDPYSEFGYLSYQMLRSCRLVVDTGLHAFGWSSEKAIQLLLDNTALPEMDVRNEVRRYIIWPGQACAYKIGELKIQELRKRAENQLGNLFDVRSFHEEILRHGMVPLGVLERLINDFIEKEQGTRICISSLPQN